MKQKTNAAICSDKTRNSAISTISSKLNCATSNTNRKSFVYLNRAKRHSSRQMLALREPTSTTSEPSRREKKYGKQNSRLLDRILPSFDHERL